MAKKAFVYDGTNWVDIAQSTADLSNYANMTTTPISGFRNAIINGDFRIWQRGTSFSIPNQVVTYHADRFFTWNAGNGTVTVSRQDFTPGNTISGYEPQHYLRTAVTSVGTSTEFNIGQRIEDVRTFAGQTITISVWMKSDANRTVGVKEFQNFGTGGSTFASMSLGNFNVTTSWQRFSVTTTVPSISGKTIGTGSNFTIEFSLPASNQTTDMWGMQVEKGTIATPFEQRPIGLETMLCQRYYEELNLSFSRWYGANVAASGDRGTINYPFSVQKRITPNVTIKSGATTGVGGWKAETGGYFTDGTIGIGAPNNKLYSVGINSNSASWGGIILNGADVLVSFSAEF